MTVNLTAKNLGRTLVAEPKRGWSIRRLKKEFKPLKTQRNTEKRRCFRTGAENAEKNFSNVLM